MDDFMTIDQNQLSYMIGWNGIYNHTELWCQLGIHQNASGYNYDVVSFAENGIVVKYKNTYIP